MGLQEIHRDFEHLVHTLTTTGSLRCKIFSLDRFLTSALNNPRLYESYLLELTEKLPGSLPMVALTGMHPDRLNTCLRHVEKIRGLFAEVADLEAWQIYEEQLREVIAILYGFCGDLSSLHALYYPGKDAPAWLPDEGTPLQRITRAESEARQRNHGLRERLTHIAEQMSSLARVDASYLRVPVIDYCRKAGEAELTGRMIFMRATHVANTGAPEDRIQIASPYQVHGAEKGASCFFNTLMEAVKTALVPLFPKLGEQNYEATISFDPASAGYEGRSAELAVACALYARMFTMLDPRCDLRINSSVAITGMISSNGSVEPVDPDTLELKVEAAFFSGQQQLVVPMMQKNEAANIARGLQARFPARKLVIFGVEHLSDVINDRRLTYFHRTGRMVYTVRKAWQNRYSVASIAIILMLSLIIFRLTYGPIDQQPVSAEFSGKYMYVMNSSGQKVDHIEVGEETARRTEQSGDYKPYGFRDVTGNGLNDIFWADMAREETGNVDIIYGKCAESDTTLWSHQLVKELEFPNTPDVQSPHFRVYEIIPADLGYDFPVLVVRTNHPTFFPSMVMILNAENGNVVQSYLHPGNLYRMELQDINGDGTQEIILAGLSNVYDQAVLTVLNARNIQGQAPYTERYYVAGYSRAEEYAYIRIPKTRLAEVMQYVSRYNRAIRLQINQEQELIRLRIIDFTLTSNDFLDADEGRIFAYFNFDLDIVGFSRANEYDLAARQLYDEGYIDEIPDYTYFEELQNEVLYLRDEEWVRFGDL